MTLEQVKPSNRKRFGNNTLIYSACYTLHLLSFIYWSVKIHMEENTAAFHCFETCCRPVEAGVVWSVAISRLCLFAVVNNRSLLFDPMEVMKSLDVNVGSSSIKLQPFKALCE